jgi:hypothetical protein
MGCAGVYKRVRNPVRVWHRYLSAAAAPPGDVRVQRGSDFPRCRGRMPADRPPRRPSTGKGFVHKVLRRVFVANTDQYLAEAYIPGLPVELREVRLMGFHTYSTRNLLPWPTCQVVEET